MRRRGSKVDTWYQQGAQAARFLFEDGRAWYVCPLCMKGFPPEALGRLSEEHVPTAANGGSKMVLTCKDCNNRAGSEIDSHARAMEDILDFGRGTLSKAIPIDLRIAGQDARATMRAEGDSIHVEIYPKANNPAVSDLLLDAMNRVVVEGSWGDTTFDIKFRRSFSYRRALVSWLRAGYLAAFAALGYRYIAQGALSVVREQISNPEAEIINVFSLTTADAPLGERRILLIGEPEWMKSVGVQMGRHTIFLPPGGRSDGFYARFEEEAHGQKELRAASRIVPWPLRPTFLLDEA